jgi:hypothetical protein
MADYSKTPLLQKLGLKKDQVIYVDNFAPYFPQIEKYITLNAGKPYDFIHIFVKNRSELHRSLTFALTKLAKKGILWVSWPKKAVNAKNDLDENIIRDFGLTNGIVDVKVAAIDEIWSGLKFVFRIKDR